VRVAAILHPYENDRVLETFRLPGANVFRGNSLEPGDMPDAAIVFGGDGSVHRVIQALAGTKTRLLDTRKTSPGMRELEKAAVRAGGGLNHRGALFDGILVKDNHAAAAGGVGDAVRRARVGAHPLLKVEAEVSTPQQIEEALAAGADMLLLDNLGDAELKEAVRQVGGRVPLEASGGMTLDRLPRVAAAGVDYVSVGALTHSAPAVDLSLLVEGA